MKNLNKVVEIRPAFTAEEWGVRTDMTAVEVTDTVYALNYGLVKHYKKPGSTRDSLDDSMHRIIRRLDSKFVDHGRTAVLLLNSALAWIYAEPRFW
jgi:hypothetical protein